MTWQAFTWSLAVLSIVGVVLNIRRKRACFYIWASHECFVYLRQKPIEFPLGIFRTKVELVLLWEALTGQSWR